MGADDRPADRESHAHALGLRREEGVEDPIGYRRIKPRSAILDRDPQPAWFHGFPGYCPSLRAVPDRGHGFNRVHEQVQQPLLARNPVTKDRPIGLVLIRSSTQAT